MNWKHWVTTQEPWHYSSSCCLSIQPFLQNNYPPPHFRISFVKLVTDLFILLAFAAFFYLFPFFVIFFRFLLCFVVFLIWWCFLALLLASQDHCNFCYFLLSAMVGLLCLRIVCPESRETEKSIKARGAQTQGFSTLDDTPGQIQQCEEEEEEEVPAQR